MIRRAAWLTLLLIAVALPMAAQSSPAAAYFGGIVLTDQDGHRVRLYEDLMKGRTIVLNSFFASCSASCPVMGRAYVALQERFAGRLGKELTLVSITVDPENDTPAKLKEYAAKQHAKPGWVLLTGSKAEVEGALRKIGQYVESRDAHFNIMIVGNEPTGLWKKAFALAKPEEIAAIVESVLDDKGVPPPSPAPPAQ
jgi:protein SCO1